MNDFGYFKAVIENLEKVNETQSENIRKAARAIEAVKPDQMGMPAAEHVDDAVAADDLRYGVGGAVQAFPILGNRGKSARDVRQIFLMYHCFFRTRL